MINILNFCKSSAGYKIMGFLGIFINVIKICIPIILILIGTIELVKALVAQKDEMTKTIKNLITKCIYAIIIFFVPTIIMFLVSLIGVNYDGETCVNCLLDIPTACIEIGNNMSSNISNSDSFCSTNHNNPEACTTPCEYTNGLCQKVDRR